MKQHEQLGDAAAQTAAGRRAQALTRATFLRRSAAGAIGATTLSALLAACGEGGSASSGAGKAATATATLKPDIAVRYDPSLPAGAKPSGLPRSFDYVAFSTDSFWVTFSNAMKQAADDVGLDFGDANAQADASKYLTLIQQQLTRGFGGTFVAPIDPKAEASLVRQVMDSGAYVVADAFPGTTQIGENYLAYGKRIGEEAAKYINAQLGGKAEVLIFNEGETVGFLKERWDGVRMALKQHAPGATVVKDLATPRNTADEGFRFASSAFAANPGIKVILGPGLSTLGAVAALEANGKATPDMYIASVGGTNDELKAIKKPNSPYKGTWAEPWLLLGYLSALWTGAWLDGKSVPMGVELPASVVTLDNIAKYETDMADPGKVVAEGRVGEYVGLWGTINYATRASYYTKPWFGPTA